MSWQIFIHSVRQVFGNLEGALRVSAALTIVQIVITLTIGRALLGDQADMQARMMAGDFNWAGYAASLLLLLFTSLWIAVGWHRYILTNETPQILPKLHLDRVMGYFGKSLLIGLIIVPVAMIAGVIVGLAVFPLFGDELMTRPFLIGIIFGLLVYIPIGVIMMRLSTMLPGVALQAGVPVMAGWEATRGQTGTIFVVVVLTVVASLVLSAPSFGLLGSPTSVVALVWRFVSQWVMVMVGVSILTTLYGHYIEKRPLV